MPNLVPATLGPKPLIFSLNGSIEYDGLAGITERKNSNNNNFAYLTDISTLLFSEYID